MRRSSDSGEDSSDGDGSVVDDGDGAVEYFGLDGVLVKTTKSESAGRWLSRVHVSEGFDDETGEFSWRSWTGNILKEKKVKGIAVELEFELVRDGNTMTMEVDVHFPSLDGDIVRSQLADVLHLIRHDAFQRARAKDVCAVKVEERFPGLYQGSACKFGRVRLTGWDVDEDGVDPTAADSIFITTVNVTIQPAGDFPSISTDVIRSARTGSGGTVVHLEYGADETRYELDITCLLPVKLNGSNSEILKNRVIEYCTSNAVMLDGIVSAVLNYEAGSGLLSAKDHRKISNVFKFKPEFVKQVFALDGGVPRADGKPVVLASDVNYKADDFY
jgi:hypothetical protein